VISPSSHLRGLIPIPLWQKPWSMHGRYWCISILVQDVWILIIE
jgi:hypothetical protein